MAEVVYTGITDDARLSGSLFKGIKFWLSQRVPQRSRFIAEVKVWNTALRALGSPLTLVRPMVGRWCSSTSRRMLWLWITRGRRRSPERKSAPFANYQKSYDSDSCRPSYSYTFIERSIRNGHLEDMEDHKVGPALGTVRSIGSSIQPSKTTRSKYTEDDDRVLWNWVYSHTQKGGGTDGNEIYKQLEVQVRIYWVWPASEHYLSSVELAAPMAIMERSMDKTPQRKTTSSHCSCQCTTYSPFRSSTSTIRYRNVTETSAEEKHLLQRGCRGSTRKWGRYLEHTPGEDRRCLGGVGQQAWCVYSGYIRSLIA